MPFEIPFIIECVYPLMSIDVNHAVSTASPELTTIHADECLLHCYKGVYYNIPVQVKSRQLLFYVICGSHIGVMAGWENALNCVLGIANPDYREVESVALGEQLVREAIDQGRIEMVEPVLSMPYDLKRLFLPQCLCEDSGSHLSLKLTSYCPSVSHVKEERSKVKTPLQSIGQLTKGRERDKRVSGLCEVHVAPKALRQHIEDDCSVQPNLISQSAYG
ncbi:uncharacterized protein F5891DRAFT_986449 [Suillus fuscotomentosus]|uniref:Uncharacterized protein n=1 Tax=Suillus fuscotomentosus TaxID=1912939 RepID=A0AAD4DRV3_9AGAM|nr:uncharacterized protein F5891DRAFT_986449 [Suillus fuscotomentosus]KAG1891890.1 hypothetical protein F5891DRAFT_986449 [Suillus fuscotomentosus]